jgi:hypothetical protein
LGLKKLDLRKKLRVRDVVLDEGGIRKVIKEFECSVSDCFFIDRQKL